MPLNLSHLNFLESLRSTVLKENNIPVSVAVLEYSKSPFFFFPVLQVYTR
jgi:hypothetical protein